MSPAPVLFIHGAFSNPGHFAAWQALFARAGYECHAVALPGHVPSDAEALEALTIRDFLRAVLEAIADLSAPPILVGHSMGGLLAQQAAAASPCRALICVASAPPWMLAPPPASLPRMLPLMPAILSGSPVPPDESTLAYLVVNDLPRDEREDLLCTFGGESGLAYRAMVMGTARLPGQPFSGPVLCHSGDCDRVVTQRTSQAIARIYGARHEIFHCGHWLIAPSAAPEVAGCALRWLEEMVG